MAASALATAGAWVYLTSCKAAACVELAARSGAVVHGIAADLYREDECALPGGAKPIRSVIASIAKKMQSISGIL
jgi:hypothetical protein